MSSIESAYAFNSERLTLKSVLASNHSTSVFVGSASFGSPPTDNSKLKKYGSSNSKLALVPVQAAFSAAVQSAL